MAGRNHPYSRQQHRRPSIDGPRLLHQGLHRPHPAALIEAQQREIQALLLDNQRLAATHVALKQELAVADQELRHLSSTAVSVKADTDARVHEVYERSLKTEAELLSIDELGADLSQVKTDIQNMTADRKEFTSKLRELNEELVLAHSELEQLPAIQEEIQDMRQEIKRGRAAIEYEKKMHATNLEQSQIIEKNMISMAHEIEKLHAELADAEKRARAAAAASTAATPAPGYASVYSEAVYGGNLYSDHYPMQQVQGGINVSTQYGPGGVPHGTSAPYDVQWSNVHR
ncbi:protein FLC EXPRESSOR [Coffea eugenioides]|uniref:protein FLC EXPRESSOR n=1 Tax=Coffea eugenioides TaxID=49369 RepID=UPI000F6048E7|nr:protein FLC EXPRESSOR [Coffea eugenioides]